MITIPEGTPTDLVIRYRQQGYQDDQIIQALQQQGYNSQQIFDGMNQADQKPGAPTTGGPATADTGDSEALVESVVEEKWVEIRKKIEPLITWKDSTEATLVKLQQEIDNLKESVNQLHEGVLGKISEYDTNLQDVGSSIKAMDQVFKKVLPSLTESVNKLNRISKK